MEWIFLMMIAVVLWFIERKFSDANMRIEEMKDKISSLEKRVSSDSVAHIQKRIEAAKSALTLNFEGKEVPRELMDKALKDLEKLSGELDGS